MLPIAITANVINMIHVILKRGRKIHQATIGLCQARRQWAAMDGKSLDIMVSVEGGSAAYLPPPQPTK